jgi:hypothetical protein
VERRPVGIGVRTGIIQRPATSSHDPTSSARNCDTYDRLYSQDWL